MSGQIRAKMLEPGIVEVMIDHPERLNAVNRAMWDGLSEIMCDLDKRDDVRCVVLTGAGEQAFSAGADISEFNEARGSAEKARTYASHTEAALGAVSRCRHPVIAAIHGLCVGGGLELASRADIRICAASSRFGIPVKRLGLVVAYSEMQALIELVGKANTLQILLEGELCGADQALHMGLVNRIAADGEVAEAARMSARKIASGAPLVARWHKKFASRLMDPRPLSEAERAESYDCFDTEDYRIGKQAFLDKTKARFVGR